MPLRTYTTGERKGEPMEDVVVVKVWVEITNTKGQLETYIVSKEVAMYIERLEERLK